MMGTRNNKVRLSRRALSTRALTSDGRYPDCVDRVEWHGHGIELSRGRGLHCNMVGSAQIGGLLGAETWRLTENHTGIS